MVKLTELEAKIIAKLKQGDFYQEGEGGDYLYEIKSLGDMKTLRGALGSLAKKGIVKVGKVTGEQTWIEILED